MKMMLISQNIILMPVKKIAVTKRSLVEGVAQSLDLHFHCLHHTHPPPQVQGPGPDPVQGVLPVRSQDLVPVPENIRDLVGRNQDPALGPTGAPPLPHEKDLTQVHCLLLRETEREVVLDLLHPVMAKKDEQDHGTTGHLLDRPILVPVHVQKRNNVLKFTY
uniref:Uncharacterized protein n=1 Tax=Oryctolagus cuniculus TaxID=9986 RepID=A0A5F9DIV1_RABIT